MMKVDQRQPNTEVSNLDDRLNTTELHQKEELRNVSVTQQELLILQRHTVELFGLLLQLYYQMFYY